MFNRMIFIIIGLFVGLVIGLCSVKTVVEVVEVPVPKTEYVYIETEPDMQYIGSYTVTAYCPCKECCDKWADGVTKTGTEATEGRTIAVDPSVIPYGTEVIINGHKYIAEDCGGAIKGNHIDIFFDNHEDALKFGVQEKDVYVYGK